MPGTIPLARVSRETTGHPMSMDAESLSQLYERYYEPIFRYCVHRLFTKDAAEEATSTVFLRVAERLDSFRGRTERQFRNWLYAIATNATHQLLRQSARRQKLLETVAFQRVQLARLANGGEDGWPSWPELYAAIARLKGEHQAIITLRFFEGLGSEEIAEILGKKPGAVRVTLSRALGKLRAALSAADKGHRR